MIGRLAAAIALTVALASACQPSTESAGSSAPPSRAQAIVDSAIAAHGGEVLDRAVVAFDFRGVDFRLKHDGGRFRYERTYTDSLGRSVREVLSNDSLYRTVGGERVELSPAERRAVETDVNSVAYFALLPYPLHDPAVQPEYTGIDTVEGDPYHRVRVTFQQEGGGRDWEDVFLYWFATDTYAMDYLAYAYGLGPNEDDVGTRFREAYNVREIEGVRVADYLNYTDTTIAYDQPDQMRRYPDRLEEDALQLYSRIELDSVQVEPLEAPDS